MITNKIIDYSIVRLTSHIFKILLYTIFYYFAFKFIQLIYRRLQDFNQPGYYLIGLLPVVSMFIGVNIYKSGYKVLGIIVFLNLAVAIPYILIVSEPSVVNYFGVKSGLISTYLKEKKKIMSLNYLSNSEKAILISQLSNKYFNIEESEKVKFINNEVNRLIKEEKFTADENEFNIFQKRKDYYENIVKERLGKCYSIFNWD